MDVEASTPDRQPAVLIDLSASPPFVALGREASFDDIRTEVKERLEPVKADWAGAEVHIDLGEREPDLFHLRRLIHLLKDEFGVHVVGLRCDPGALRRFAERELKVRIHLPPEVALAAVAEPEAPEASPGAEEPAAAPAEEPVALEPAAALEPPDPVRVEQRTLRSGAVLRHGGDVVLYGDVNPGAEIVAGGSITVLGTLMGVAHAGTRTGDRAWVLALEIRATQLRIGQRITHPQDPGAPAGRTARAPELALVREGVIVIEPWRGRLPRDETRRSDA